MTTDEQLMLDVQRGARGAFEQLFERYRGPIWRFFRRRVADSARAEELAQDAFVAVLQGTARYEPRAPFRSYLFGIAYNLLLAERRKSSHRTAEPLDHEPAECARDPEAQIWVRTALGELDADDREILMLREYEQLSYQEIAHLTQMPVNTVRSRLFRARLALQASNAARRAFEVPPASLRPREQASSGVPTTAPSIARTACRRPCRRRGRRSRRQRQRLRDPRQRALADRDAPHSGEPFG